MPRIRESTAINAGEIPAGSVQSTRVSLPSSFRLYRHANNKRQFTRTWMYNTGDIGRLLPSGEFEHLGRQDDQVKVKGFRVELDGIASSIASCPGVVLSASILTDDGELCGFYMPKRVPSEEIRRRVTSEQPYYAVPKMFVGLDEMPLTRYVSRCQL